MSHRISLAIIFLCLFICALSAPASAQSDFSRFNYTAGGGLGIGRTYVAAFVGDSFHGVAGGGINFNRLVGMDVEYMYYDLSFRPSVRSNQSIADASGKLQSISLNAIINVPKHYNKLGAYGIFGAGFYRRSVSTRRQLLTPGTVCQEAWVRWWDVNCTGNIILTPQTLSSNDKDAAGFNYGGGITYPIAHLHSKLFIEVRYHHAYQSDVKTTVVPITVGLRW